MSVRTTFAPIALILALSMPPSYAATIVFSENFETSSPDFVITNTAVSSQVQSADASYGGLSSFKVTPTSCSLNCFDGRRVDLVHTFASPTYISTVSLWALEDSTTSSAWGGKMRVGHNGVWDLDWWGIVDNGNAITDEWMFQGIEINDTVSTLEIRIWDVTNRSTVWLDEVQAFGAQAAPLPATLALLAMGLGLLSVSRNRTSS